jgi:hypothetical protein
MPIIRGGTATASGGSQALGVFVAGATVTLKQLIVSASGSGAGNNVGVWVDAGATVGLRSCSVESTGAGAGVLTHTGALGLVVEQSAIKGGAVSANRVAGTLRLVSSKLEGATNGSPTCTAVYNASYTYGASACP